MRRETAADEVFRASPFQFVGTAPGGHGVVLLGVTAEVGKMIQVSLLTPDEEA
jgi:hypothetical protein